jgi:hypothetical protein
LSTAPTFKAISALPRSGRRLRPTASAMMVRLRSVAASRSSRFRARSRARIFYPASTGQAEDDVIDEAYVEHDGAKVLISELLNSDPSNEFYDAKIKVLSEDIKHHVKEEEKPS